MIKFNKTGVLLVILAGLSGCGGAGDDIPEQEVPNIVEVSNVLIKGGAFKGPFVKDSAVKISYISETGSYLDSKLETKVFDDLGTYSFEVEENSIIEIATSGQYRNEIDGKVSNSPLTLTAIYKADSDLEQTVNVNILTHFVSRRVINLMAEEDIEFDSALTQAREELVDTLKLVIPTTPNFPFLDSSIFETETNDHSAYLLTVSSLFYQYAINESEIKATEPSFELSLIVNQFDNQFTTNGIVTDNIILAGLFKAQLGIDPVVIKENLSAWVLGTPNLQVPNIDLFLDSDLDGLVNEADDDDDNDGLKDSEDINPIEIDVLLEGATVSTNEDNSIIIDLSPMNFTDIDFSVNLAAWPENGELIIDYPQAIYYPRENFYGEDSFSYKLIREGVESDVVSINISVLSVNDKPVIDNFSSQILIANEIFEFIPTVRDVDSPTFTFKVENLPGWATLNADNGTIYGVPKNSDVGVYSDIELSVSDGDNDVIMPSFSLQVNYSQLNSPNNISTVFSDLDKEIKVAQFSWDNVVYAKNYEIQFSTFSDFRTIFKKSLLGINTYDFTAEAGEYFYRIRTINPDDLEGEWSEVNLLELGVFKVSFGGAKRDILKEIVQTEDGSIVILATTHSTEISSTAGSKGDDWIFKVDNQGRLIWQYVYPSDGYDLFNDFELLSDGSIIAVGFDGQTKKGIAIKLDKDGTLLWDTRFAPQGHTTGYTLSDIVSVGENIYVSGIKSWPCDSSGCKQEFNFIHTLSSLTGELSSGTVFVESQGHDLRISNLNKTQSGNLIVSGTGIPEGIDTSSYWLSGTFFQMFDSELNIISSWDNIGDDELLAAYDILELSNGNFALVGTNSYGKTYFTVLGPTGEAISSEMLSDYSYLGGALSEDINGHIEILLKDDSNSSNLYSTKIVKLDEQLNIISSEDLTGLIIRESALINNKDGTSTLILSAKESEYEEYDILVIKQKN